MNMVPDRGSIPLASTTIYTHEDEMSHAGISSEYLCYERLRKLVTATATRQEINNYLYDVEKISKYLPHLKIDGCIGRPKTYKKQKSI